MNKTLVFLLGVGNLFLIFTCQNTEKAPPEAYFGIPIIEVQQELDNLVALWYPRIVDTSSSGGYLTNFEFDWTKSEDQPKMLVTQARGLWTAARLYQAYPQKPELREAADHGYRFLTQTLWDEQLGGYPLHWPASAQESSYRLTYANAFALYALAEYAKINPDTAVLQWVEKSFDWLEENAHDDKAKGYYNLVTFEDGANDRRYGVGQKLGWGNGEWKGQNTSIHLLEALTNAYTVLKRPKVQERLEEMLQLVRDTFVQENGNLRLYFTNNWQAVDHRDSSRAYILEHIHDDHVSFGHDIETAFLLFEAATVLKDGEVDAQTLAICKRMLDHSLQFGFADQYQGIFEKGYYFKDQDGMEITDQRKSWWAQAEAWHALGLFAELFPAEAAYQKGFQQMWDYMKKHLIDPEHGGWYNYGVDEHPDNVKSRKAHQWKGAYHNGRALVQILDYAKGETKAH